MYCSHCNAELKDNAIFCPHCGSDYQTGWSEGAEFSDLDLPDYEEIVENEFGNNLDFSKKKLSKILIGIVAFIVILAFMMMMIL